MASLWLSATVLGDLSGVAKIYLVSGYTDMRRSIDGLMAIVRDTYELDSYSTHKCEECSKEGTHELTGLDGSPEYYCTEHYNELVDIVNSLYGD